jgi:hypothetical protein
MAGHSGVAAQVLMEPFRLGLDLVGLAEDAVSFTVVGGHGDQNHPSIGGEPGLTEDVTVGWHGLRAPVDFGAVLHTDHSVAKGLLRV